MFSRREEARPIQRPQERHGCRMGKSGRYVIVVCVLAVLLAGCGHVKLPEYISDTTVIVHEDGSVTYHLVGDFGETWYDLSELTSMAREEAEEFSGERAGGDVPAVTVEQVDFLADAPHRVDVTYRFDSGESFGEFNGISFYFGTVEEAVSQGHTEGMVLKSVKDGTVKTEEQLGRDGAKKIIITDAKALIYCPARVTYISDGAVVNEDGSVDTAKADDTVYILLK